MDFRNILKRLFLWNRPHVYTDAEMMGGRLAVGNYKSPPQENSANAISERANLAITLLETYESQLNSSTTVLEHSGPTREELLSAITKGLRARQSLRIVKS